MDIKIPVKDFMKSCLFLVLSTIIGIVFYKLNINETNIILVYILGVVLIAYTTKNKICSLVSSFLAVITFNFFFTVPLYSFHFNDTHYPLTFLIMFIVAFLVSSITEQLKEESAKASLKAYNSEMLLEMSKKLQEAELRNKQEELRSTFLRAISHDLRTPLTGISGFADILINNSDMLSEEKKQQIYADIYDDSIWLYNLVENILAITRFDKNEIEIKKESEFVSDVISDAITHLGRKKNDYNIETDIEDELCAKIDGRLVAQVIFNLVDNAVKYSPKGTNIRVSAKKSYDKIKISVSDEGKGIPDEDKQKIFDMFYTVHNSVSDGRRGLGLGLALCKAVIKAHGGEIYIQDNSPSGTVFSFCVEGDYE